MFSFFILYTLLTMLYLFDLSANVIIFLTFYSFVILCYICERHPSYAVFLGNVILVIRNILQYLWTEFFLNETKHILSENATAVPDPTDKVTRCDSPEDVVETPTDPPSASNEYVCGNEFDKTFTLGTGWSLPNPDDVRLQHLTLEQEADVLYKELKECGHWNATNHVSNVFWGYREHITVKLSDVQYRLGKPVTAINETKFCNESLIHFRRRVLKKFSPVPSVSTAESRSNYFQSKLKLRPENTVVCDLTDIIAKHGDENVATQQYRCLESVMETVISIINAASVDSLLLIGYPLYTQISVACFIAVVNMFDKYGLVKPQNRYGHAIVFKGFKRHSGWFRTLATAKNLLMPEENAGLSLISWISIKKLLNQKVYADIVAVNNLCIVNETKPILSSVLGYNS